MSIELIIQSNNNSRLTLPVAPSSFDDLVIITKKYFSTDSNAFTYLDDYDSISVNCQYDYLQAITFAREIKRNSLILTICESSDWYLLNNQSDIVISNAESIVDQQVLSKEHISKETNDCIRIDNQFSTDLTEERKFIEQIKDKIGNYAEAAKDKTKEAIEDIKKVNIKEKVDELIQKVKNVEIENKVKDVIEDMKEGFKAVLKKSWNW